MIRVLAIDPGMKHTGVALVDEHGVSCATTLAYTAAVNTDRARMRARCDDICQRLDDLLATWHHDVVVMEQFDIRADVRSNAIAATQGIYLEGWLTHFLVEARGEIVHLQTPLEVFSPKLDYSIYWYLGANKIRGLDKEEELRKLAELMPGGVNCHGARDQIQAAAHGIKYIYDHQRLFDL